MGIVCAIYISDRLLATTFIHCGAYGIRKECSSNSGAVYIHDHAGRSILEYGLIDIDCGSASSEFEVSTIAEFNLNVAIDLNSDIDANCRCRDIQR